ncbi:MAG: YbaN family protein [Pirellulales bacterium]
MSSKQECGVRARYRPADARLRTGLFRDEFASPPLSSWRRTAYLIVAAASFALGMLGVVLPGLPTTPFLLVTSALLLRSWPSMHERMLRSRIVGGLLSDWRHHRGVRPHVKIRAISLVVAVVTASILFGGLSMPAVAAMVCCAVVGVLVIVSLPTIRS